MKQHFTKFEAWLIVLLCFALPVVLTAAATQINLASQVQGVLATANGGTGQNSSATFPTSGTVMTTTTTVTASQLPNPTATTLGGIESITCSASQWISSISTSGVPGCAQPAFSNISGTPSTTQVPFQSLTTTGTSGAATLSSGVLNIPQYGSITWNQTTPTGTINGSNTSFTLSPTPTQSADVNCFLNGVQQRQGASADYTISSGAITYNTAPSTGSILYCLWY